MNCVIDMLINVILNDCTVSSVSNVKQLTMNYLEEHTIDYAYSAHSYDTAINLGCFN
jgi:hypothetical protein